MKALELVSSDVSERLKNAQSFLIKVNLMHHQNQLASTHIDAVRAVIDFIRKSSSAPIVVADASHHGTKPAFRNFGYENLPNEYKGVLIKDLNDDEVVEGFFYVKRDGSKAPISKGVSKTVMNADFKISLALMKTHTNTGVTASVKNWALGIWVPKSKIGFHGRFWPRWPQIHGHGTKALYMTIAGIYEQLVPDLSVIDAYFGMEGEGPSHGTAVEMRTALAGVDAVAVDAVTCKLMGIDARQIGYLSMLAQKGCGIIDLERIELLGEKDLEGLQKEFKMPEGLG